MLLRQTSCSLATFYILLFLTLWLFGSGGVIKVTRHMLLSVYCSFPQLFVSFAAGDGRFFETSRRLLPVLSDEGQSGGLLVASLLATSSLHSVLPLTPRHRGVAVEEPRLGAPRPLSLVHSFLHVKAYLERIFSLQTCFDKRKNLRHIDEGFLLEIFISAKTQPSSGEGHHHAHHHDCV